MKTKPIKIKINKIKQLGLLIIALIMVVNGIWLTFFSDEIITQYRIFVIVIGMLSILIFGLAASINLINLSKKAGLTITDEGIYDTSSFVKSGLVNWKNIEDIVLTKVVFQNIIRIKVNNAEFFIHRQTNSLKRRIVKANFKNYGSPIQINANVLNMNHYKLIELLKEEWSKNKTISNY